MPKLILFSNICLDLQIVRMLECCSSTSILQQRMARSPKQVFDFRTFRWPLTSDLRRAPALDTTTKYDLGRSGVGVATDSRQLLDSGVHSSLVVAYSRERYTRARRTLEYATHLGRTYSRVRHSRVGRTRVRPTRTLE